MKHVMTIDTLMEAARKISTIPKNDKWHIITPEGEIYQGTINQILQELMKRHPISKPKPYEVQMSQTEKGEK